MTECQGSFGAPDGGGIIDGALADDATSVKVGFRWTQNDSPAASRCCRRTVPAIFLSTEGLNALDYLGPEPEWNAAQESEHFIDHKWADPGRTVATQPI